MQGVCHEMNDQTHPADDILTVQEAADLIRVDRRTLYRYVQQNAIPYMRVGAGGRPRFSKHELLQWMRGHGATPVQAVANPVQERVTTEVPTGRLTSHHDTPDESRNIMVIAGFGPKRGNARG